jgi:hypothetical protein
LNYIYDTKSASSLADVAESTVGFEQQAADWLRSLPHALDLDCPSVGEESELHHSLKFILKGHLLDCYEMMYWPFIVYAVNHDTPSERTESSCTGKDIESGDGLFRIKGAYGLCGTH